MAAARADCFLIMDPRLLIFKAPSTLLMVVMDDWQRIRGKRITKLMGVYSLWLYVRYDPRYHILFPPLPQGAPEFRPRRCVRVNGDLRLTARM